LPHLDAIQRSFGRHDVSQIEAHTDHRAAAAAEAMGAEAFARGHHVAFAGTPSLHTAAHEAAHVVQQRAGVQLKGGVGEVGDPYERHADAVADAVVQGKSSEALLDAYAGTAGPPGMGHRAVAGVTGPAVVARKEAQAAPPAAGKDKDKDKDKPRTFTLFGKIFLVNKAGDGKLSIAPKQGDAGGWTFTESTATPGTFVGARSEPQLKYIRAGGTEEAMTEQVQIQVPGTGDPVVGDVQAVLGDPPSLQVKLSKTSRGLKAADKTTVTVLGASVERLNYTAAASFKPAAGDTIALGGLGDAMVYSDLQSEGPDKKPVTVSGFSYIGEYTRYKTTRGVTNVSGVTDAAKAASFDKLAAAGTITADDATLFKAVATIEAPFSGVQNYDTGILSLGFAQWTAHSDLTRVLKRVPADVLDKYVGKYGLTVGDPKLGTDGFVGKFVASADARRNNGVRNKSEGAMFIGGKEVVSEALYQASGTLATKYQDLVTRAQAAKADLASTEKEKAKAAKATLASLQEALKGLPGVKADADPVKLADILVAAGSAAQTAAQQLHDGCISDEVLRANEWVLRFELLGQDPGAQLAQIQEAKATLSTLLDASWAGQKNSLMIKSHRAQAALLSTYFNNPSSARSGMKNAVSEFKTAKKKAAQAAAAAAAATAAAATAAAATAAAAAKKPAPGPTEADWNAFPWPLNDARWGTYYDAAAQKQLEDIAVVDMTSGTTDPDRRRGILGELTD
jgi:hypothetical protein